MSRSGATILVRCAAYLGAGVVLAVVDPGVGTDRRGVAVETAGSGPTWLVGPDNGLLVPLAGVLGGAVRAVALEPGQVGSGWSPGEPVGRTFDGRDLFAPVAAHLVLGRSPAALGADFDPASLVFPEPGRFSESPGAPGPPGAPDRGSGLRRDPEVGGSVLETEVTWIDHFGNVQLELVPTALGQIGIDIGSAARVTLLGPTTGRDQAGSGGGAVGRSVPARRVDAYGDLGHGEFGLVTDSTGHVALVLRQAPAARRLEPVAAGDIIRIGARHQDDARD